MTSGPPTPLKTTVLIYKLLRKVEKRKMILSDPNQQPRRETVVNVHEINTILEIGILRVNLTFHQQLYGAISGERRI